MRTDYFTYYMSWLILLGSTLVGCHQEPAIPRSGIPPTCQIYQIATINESNRDTTTYAYDTFGALTESYYRQWNGSKLTTALRQTYAYDANHYLNLRVDQQTVPGSLPIIKSYTYNYADDKLRQIVVKNYQSSQIAGTYDFSYEGNSLKTFSETDGQQTLRKYTFNASGKLTDYQDVSVSTAQIANGKVVSKRMNPGSILVTSTFDSQGQLLNETTVNNGVQTVRTYTYDQAPIWTKTQLRFRGIPDIDFGGHSAIHNVATTTVEQTQNGRITQQQTYTYRNVYNASGYLLGYARSDGARQVLIYANCP